MGQMETKPGGQRTMLKNILITPNKQRGNVIQAFSDSVLRASARVREYLEFCDPRGRFHLSPGALEEIFLMSCISRSAQLQMSDSFSCTAMSREQKVLLGADWVWTFPERHGEALEAQIVVRVLYSLDDTIPPPEAPEESLRIAEMASGQWSRPERMVRFCSSIGRDCYALFLFFGSRNDPGSISGLLSNNLHAALGKGATIDRAFLEHFFKGSMSFSTPGEMLERINQKQRNDPLTMLIRFT
ncbi:rab15 effector protein [Paramormyrops kingsleyae]|uniref:rab15 effector protein n=1 Tax=Paramormyrops kingsleyae TaxID=1676925 RepID=UPI000CD5F084|nr:rab15 effector protein [Paramormyrops kingsleyae]